MFGLDLTWTTSLLPAVSAPGDAPKPPPLLRFDPDNDEIVLGWQIEF